MKNLGVFLNNKNVLITGASGYIGSALLEKLLQYQCNILSVSRTEDISFPRVKNIVADITDENFWNKLPDNLDFVFHLSGNTSINFANNNPTQSLKASLFPITNFLRIAKERKLNLRFVFASTVTLYGLTPKIITQEIFPPSPLTIYDLHKMFAEQQLMLANSEGLIDCVILRLANVYGPSPNTNSSQDRGILNKIALRALRGEDLGVYGDGNYVRDYVFINDVVEAFILAAVTPDISGEIFNIGSGSGVTIKKAFEIVAEEVKKLTGKFVAIKNLDWPKDSPITDKRSFIADISKFNIATNWKPKYSTQLGVKELVFKLHELNTK